MVKTAQSQKENGASPRNGPTPIWELIDFSLHRCQLTIDEACLQTGELPLPDAAQAVRAPQSLDEPQVAHGPWVPSLAPLAQETV